MPERGIETDLDKILGALTNLFAYDGDARAVSIIALGLASKQLD